MAIHAYHSATVDHFEERLNKLAADSERQFGTLDSTNMLRHMRKSFESAVGEYADDVKDISTPIFRSVVFFIVTRLIKQWPSGKFKAPRYWTPPADHEFDEELELIKASAKTYLETLGTKPSDRHVHPLFGPITVRQWGLLLGPHLHHHLRQFGV